ARAEILDADLTPLLLDIMGAGFSDPSELPWLDSPPAGAWAAAVELLGALGAVHEGHLTPHGRQMAEAGMQPRLAHMVVTAAQANGATVDRAQLLAALLEERDPIRRGALPAPVDIELRMELLTGKSRRQQVNDATVDHATLARIRETASRHGGLQGSA